MSYLTYYITVCETIEGLRFNAMNVRGSEQMQNINRVVIRNYHFYSERCYARPLHCRVDNGIDITKFLTMNTVERLFIGEWSQDAG